MAKKIRHSKKKIVREQFQNKKKAIYDLKTLGYIVERLTGVEFRISKNNKRQKITINIVNWDFVISPEGKKGKVQGVLRLNNFVKSILGEKDE